jgi:hypothetical protein
MNEKFFEDLKTVSIAHAEAEADKCHLMEYRKTLKSLLMIEAETSDAKMPIAKQERYAYAHPRYVELLEGLKVAIENAVKFRHQFTVMNMKFEAERSKNARARAEAGLR